MGEKKMTEYGKAWQVGEDRKLGEGGRKAGHEEEC